MIVALSQPSTRATAFLPTALGHDEHSLIGPVGELVVARWPRLETHTISARAERSWGAGGWARFLDEPRYQHPHASLDGDRRAIFHLSVQLHPTDPALTKADWAHIAMHLASTAGLSDPDGDGPYRWAALQARPGQLDLVANLIHNDHGTWAKQPRHLQDHLTRAAHDLEDWLGLHSTRPRTPEGKPAELVVNHEAVGVITFTVAAAEPSPLVKAVLGHEGYRPDTDGRYALPAGTPASEVEQHTARVVQILRTAQIAVLTDPRIFPNSEPEPLRDSATIRAVPAAETVRTWTPDQVAALIGRQLGLLVHMRRLSETAAAWAGTRSEPGSADTAHRLEWIARRLHGIEEDLRSPVQTITPPDPARHRTTGTAPAPIPAALPPAAPAPRGR